MSTRTSTATVKLRTMLSKVGMSPAVCAQCGFSHWTEDNVRALFLVMLEELAEGKSVTLPGLGKLSLNTRSARILPNPANPDEVFDLPETRTISFLPAKTAKARLNNGQVATTRKKDA